MKTTFAILLIMISICSAISRTPDDSGLSDRKFLYCNNNTIALLPLNGFSVSSSHGLMRNSNLNISGLNVMFALGAGTSLKFDRHGTHYAFYLEPRLMTKHLSLFFPQGYSPTGFVGKNGEIDGKGFWGAWGLGINIPCKNNWHIVIDNLWSGTILGYELRVGLAWRLRGDNFPEF